MVLIIVMMMATLLLIGLAAVLPSVYQEGQREREEELVFRGYEYGRAVARFHQQFNRYPVSVKELLQTNGIRFLRKEYLDPMDPKGKWRFIHVNAAGVLLDSKNQPLNGNRSNGNPAGLGQNSSTSSGFGEARSAAVRSEVALLEAARSGAARCPAVPAPWDFKGALPGRIQPWDFPARRDPAHPPSGAQTIFKALSLPGWRQPAIMSRFESGRSTATTTSGNFWESIWASLASKWEWGAAL